jgi:XTP/dITP diphosphohydrolase
LGASFRLAAVLRDPPKSKKQFLRSYFPDPFSFLKPVKRLLLATLNAHKTREIQQILGPEFELRDLTAYPEISEIVESGKSFEENAKLKAIAISKELSALVIADDSGLEVAALDGAPGIYSARYAGEKATDKENIDRLLEELARIGAQRDQRRARFRCVLALARNGQVLGTFEGIADGAIVDQPRGSHGFGYDPIFVPNGFEETFGELPAELKNRISHRAQAIHALAAKLTALKPSD